MVLQRGSGGGGRRCAAGSGGCGGLRGGAAARAAWGRDEIGGDICGGGGGRGGGRGFAGCFLGLLGFLLAAAAGEVAEDSARAGGGHDEDGEDGRCGVGRAVSGGRRGGGRLEGFGER